MALKLNERYVGRFNAPTSAYPQGSFKNRSAPGVQDGSYLEKDWANDMLGFFSSLLSAAGVTANGNVDAVGSSQYYNALLEAVKLNLGTAARRNVGTGVNQIPDMSQFTFSGANFTFPNQLVLKYGGTTSGAGPDNTITFPTAFPVNCVAVLACYNSGNAPIFFSFNNVTRTGCTFRGYSLASATPSTPVGAGITCTWLAVGY